jgi:hypothetical protein
VYVIRTVDWLIDWFMSCRNCAICREMQIAWSAKPKVSPRTCCAGLSSSSTQLWIILHFLSVTTWFGAYVGWALVSWGKLWSSVKQIGGFQGQAGAVNCVTMIYIYIYTYIHIYCLS